MAQDLVFSGGLLVLADRMTAGTLLVRSEVIAAIVPDADGRAGGRSGGAEIDLGGDLLIPGIVDLHTDNLERQVQPRANARWPSRSAYLAHDAQCAASGITTAFDALCVGDLGYEHGRIQTFREGVADGAWLAARGLLRSEHLLHLRCELPAPDMQALLAEAVDDPTLRLVSLMDHTPGYGQHGAVDRFAGLRRREGMATAAIDALVGHQQAQRAQWRAPNRVAVLALLAGRDVVVASHDDRTAEEVADNHAHGIDVSEFPVTLEAARAARAAGMRVIAGAPNLVRGGSHSGNVSVAALLAEGLVDALASDYVPASLVEAAFVACDSAASIVQGVARVTDMPARIARLNDRGRLEPGRRADLVQVHLPEGQPGLPVVRGVWRAGRRVA